MFYFFKFPDTECTELIGKATKHEPPGIRVNNKKCDERFKNGLPDFFVEANLFIEI